MAGNNNKVVFCGGIFCDLVACADRFPRPGETLIGSKFHRGFGGKSGNAAVMCARLGGSVSVMGKIGTDDNGRSYLDAFQVENVNTDCLCLDPDNPTGVATILVNTASGENMIVIVPGANDTLSEKDVAPAEEMVKNAKMISFGLEGRLQTTIHLLSMAKKHGVVTFVNAAPARPDFDPRLYEMTDILCVNESEAEIIVDLNRPMSTDKDIEYVMGELLKKCPTVIITLGSQGAVIGQQNMPMMKKVASRKAEKVVDTTGAGDAFVGSFAFFMAQYGEEKMPIEEMVRRSCDIASRSVERDGTQASFPRRMQLPDQLFE